MTPDLGPVNRPELTRAAALLALLLVSLVAWLVSQQVAATNSLRDAERASQERRAQLMRVLGAHQDVETGQRGFQIAGSEEFLEPMRAGEAELERILPQLRQTYANDPIQSGRLKSLIATSEAKRAFSNQVVAIRSNGAEEVADSLVRQGRGRILMDRLREQIGGMIAAEVAVLGDTVRRSEQANNRLRWIIFGLLAALLGLLVAALLALRRIWNERRQALLELEDTAKRRAVILDSAMDGILTLNPSATIEGANAAARRMFSYDEDELIGRDAGMIFAKPPPIGQLAVMLQQMALEPGKPGALQEIVGRRKDGTTFPTDVAVTVASLTEGQRYVAVVRDITDRQRVDRMKTEFVATVSHELRTPLTSIAGSLGLLAGGAGGELGDRAARLIRIAHSNAERLVRLINDILDIEKLESGKMRFDNQVIELAPLLEQAIEQNRGFAETYQVSLRLEAGATPAWVFADPDRLMQVLTNLLSNAIKFSPQGSSVTLGLAAGRRRHRITVRDKGSGIPDEFRSRIFGKFAQADSSDSRSKGGTGLGLSIVNEVVARLGGSVTFDSGEGRGTEFHVHLPAVDAVSDQAPKPNMVLLLGPSFIEPIQRALRGSRYELVIAEGFAEACRLLDSAAFDALLLDMGLADEEPVQIIRYARSSALNDAVPIVALGGEFDSDFMSDPAFIVDWLHKPVEIGSLAARLEAAAFRWAGTRPRILHVDDDPDILRVVSAALGEKASVTGAASLAEARSAFERETYDLVILDLNLRDGNGAELLSELRTAGSGVPIVVFSAEDADGANVDRLEAFLTKARTPIERLVSIVEREVAKGGARK
jgi:PAS domain S-box-containing protein